MIISGDENIVLLNLIKILVHVGIEIFLRKLRVKYIVVNVNEMICASIKWKVDWMSIDNSLWEMH